MGFSPLAKGSRIPDVGRSSPRAAAISGFTIHHNAGVDAYGQATAPGREVSANYWITNDGTILPNVDETLRAWTTGAAGYPAGAESDHRNITVEVSNSPDGVRDGSWAISPAARISLAKLIGDVFARYGLGQVRRGPVAVHQDFVPTACPGPYIMQHLDSIIIEAEQYRTGGTPAPTPLWEDTMKAFSGGSTRKTVQTLTPNVDSRLRHNDKNDTTIAVGPGDVIALSATVRLKGKPGARAEISMYRERYENGTETGTRQISGARGVFDSLGLLEVTITGNAALPRGERIRTSVHPAKDAGKVTVERYSWNGYARPA